MIEIVVIHIGCAFKLDAFPRLDDFGSVRGINLGFEAEEVVSPFGKIISFCLFVKL
jgi:hypothetical protein